MLRVVCWKWDDPGYRWNHLFRYGAEHVNILAASVRRNLRMDYEFVCITDNPEGIDPDIRIVPLWDDLRDKGGCYVRLKAFSEEMREVIGLRFVSVDLDCVVTGDLTPLFDRPEDFVMWKNTGSGSLYCGSMFLMTAGSRQRVWETFDPAALEFSRLMKRKTGGWVHPRSKETGNVIGSDQAWISAVLGPGEAMWRRKDGVLSFKRHCEGRTSKMAGRQERLGHKPGLPEDARIVFFHGACDPSQPEIQKAHPWVADHWR